MNIDKNTPLWQITVEELIFCIKQSLQPQDFLPTEEIHCKKEDEYLKGLKELASFLGISYSSTWRLKNEGVFDGAIIQRGRTILIHKETVLKLFADTNSK